MDTSFTLSADQREVVDAPADWSGVVCGGPGSGKTSTLIARVVALANQPGWGPDNILVLAGNRSAATELRDRLALAIGRTSSGPIARTAASVAFEIVQSHLGRPVTLLTGAEHDSVLSELLSGEISDGTDDYWPASLSRELRALSGFRTELREFILRVEERGLGPADLVAYASASDRPEWAAVAEFLARSVNPQAAAHPDQFDSAELVAFAARIISESLPESALAAVRVVLCDDAQDATESTISLLRAWAARGVSVIAFGDPDVASNGFRGGQSDLVGQFRTVLRLPEAPTMFLTEHRRGGSELRRQYARVVEAIGTRNISGHREPVHSAQIADESPHWHRLLAASPATEARAIADELRSRHVLDEVPWHDMAVIVRTTRLAKTLESTLARLGVPTSRSVSRQLLRDDTGARWLLDAADLSYQIASGTSPDADARIRDVYAILSGPFAGFDPIELRRFRLQLRTAGIALADALQHPLELELLGTALGSRASRALQLLNSAARTSQTGSIEDVLWELWSGSPVAQQWPNQSSGRGPLADEANAALDAVVALFAAAKRFVERRPTESGVVFLAEQFEAAIPEDLIVTERSRAVVTVTTPSQVVGRDFDTVVIAGLTDGVWPNLRPRFSLLHADELIAKVTGSDVVSDLSAERQAVRGDEYRLFALALSRARQRVVLSAHRSDDANVSVLFGDASTVQPAARQPSRLRDLAGALRRQLVLAVERGTNGSVPAAALARLANAGVPGADPSDWYGLRDWSTREPLHVAGEVERPIRVSPSSIDKIEASSLAWFVDTHAPGVPSDAQATGTIIHAALETLGADPNVAVSEYEALVMPQLAQLPVPAEWMRAQTERHVRSMLQRLCQYLERAAAAGRVLVAAEAPFTLRDGDVVVSGVIDRVERTAAGAYYVVDLKTGKHPVSTADAANSSQMQCYQLAIFENEVAFIEPGPLEGAALLYPAHPTASPTLRVQDPLTDETAAEVWNRIHAAAEAMAGPEYLDYEEISDTGTTAARRYRIQVVPGVCA